MKVWLKKQHASQAADAQLDWLQLIRSENVGPVTFWRLLEFYGSAAKALQALPDLARRGGAKRAPKIAARSVAEKELAACGKLNVQLLLAADAAYPAALAELVDAPPVVLARGDLSLLARPNLAVVGARNASLNARKFTEQVAADLGAAGYVVTSGMARGIDGAAHSAALSTGTVAVLAGGVDVIYPEEHAALYENICLQGLVISEAPLGHAPLARDFPRRNRIISGVARGTVVVEATLNSGSLITARMAAEQGREVFAVPGSPMDARCRGTNQLLREGAILVESAADILRELSTEKKIMPVPAAQLPIGLAAAPATPPLVAEPDAQKAQTEILALLSTSPTLVDDVLRQSQLPAPAFALALLELELAGRVQRQRGNYLSLVYSAEETARESVGAA